MPEYISRKIVKQILGINAKHFDVVLEEYGTPPHFIHPPTTLYGVLEIQKIYEKARLLRAYLSEDEGVTYP